MHINQVNNCTIVILSNVTTFNVSNNINNNNNINTDIGVDNQYRLLNNLHGEQILRWSPHMTFELLNQHMTTYQLIENKLTLTNNSIVYGVCKYI